MKLFVKLLVAALVIGMLLPFTLLKGKDGNTLIGFSDLQMPELSLPDWPFSSSSKKNVVSDLIKNSEGKDLIYRWTDSSGNLQFSNTPPPEGVEFSVKGYDPNQNLIQALKPEPEKPAATTETESRQDSGKSAIVANPYSPEKIEKLIDDANNIEKLLNDRLKKQQAVLGD